MNLMDAKGRHCDQHCVNWLNRSIEHLFGRTLEFGQIQLIFAGSLNLNSLQYHDPIYLQNVKAFSIGLFVSKDNNC
ncbi:hypothetical protein CEXT_368831 [Caerostris extrusa]|uniref:Uncharacterized protein n=1 Tax=Caerostris extrusa TaxID=172846 RepID=A0AAV4Q8G5_CAEEX|nr:hypothetical protein CEXT_368831 [Caerostris extrusa]